MHRTLERLDGAASTIVPLLYLAGLLLGTLAYFTGLSLDFGLSVGVALACAAETHAFLEQRRTRAVWGILARVSDDDPRRDALVSQLRLHVGILAGLVLFSTYNSIAFVASTWRPAPGFLPGWVQVGIRGAVVPALFLLTGALAPLSEDAGALLARASHDMLHRTLKATLKQWRRRVERAYRTGLDLAPITVTLMQDAGDVDGARRVQLIADGLRAAEDSSQYPALAARSESPRSAPQGQVPPERPPTGPGSPVAAHGSNPTSPGQRSRKAEVITLVEPPEWKRKRQTRTASAEQRVRALLQREPGLPVKQIAKRLHISPATASKYARLMRAESERAGQVAQ